MVRAFFQNRGLIFSHSQWKRRKASGEARGTLIGLRQGEKPDEGKAQEQTISHENNDDTTSTTSPDITKDEAVLCDSTEPSKPQEEPSRNNDLLDSTSTAPIQQEGTLHDIAGPGMENGNEAESCKKTRSVPKSGQEMIQVTTVALTTDHKPGNEDEKKRIEEAGGIVVYSKIDGVPRLNGKIAVSRSLGDLHDPNVDGYLSQEPDIRIVDLVALSKKQKRATTESLFLVLACDGLWDMLTNEEAGEIIKEKFCAKASLHEMTEALMKTSYDKGSNDNITAVVVDLSSFCTS